jgi:hypothetical protein
MEVMMKDEKKAEVRLMDCFSFKGNAWGCFREAGVTRRRARSRAWAKRQTSKARRHLDKVCAKI